MRRQFIFWIIAATAIFAGFAHAAGGTAKVELPTAVSSVYDTGIDRTQIWFKLDDDRRFVLDRRSTPDPRAVIAALRDARKTNRAVFASYDPATGTIDAKGRITFVTRRLTYDGRVLEGAREPAALPPPADTRERAHRDLALSTAYRDLGDLEKARSALNRALDSSTLEPELHIQALLSRGTLASDLAFDLALGSQARADAYLMDALGDFRAALILSPGSWNALGKLAQTLTGLGAYDEASLIYQSMIDANPRQAYWPTLDAETARRLARRPDEALALLDELVRRNGAQDDMPYHYHRGWALSDLGREEEAVAELTLGLKSQPDYQWGWIRRACSEARLGRLKAALADQEKGVSLSEEIFAARPQRPAFGHNLGRAKEVLALLRTQVAKDETAKIDGLCDGYWPGDGERRSRSPLLPRDAPRPRDGAVT